MHTEKGKIMTDYSIVTEVSGEKVSNEQILGCSIDILG